MDEPEESIGEYASRLREDARKQRAETLETIAASCDASRQCLLDLLKALSRVRPITFTVEDMSYYLDLFKAGCRQHARRNEVIAEALRRVVEFDKQTSREIDRAAKGFE